MGITEIAVDRLGLRWQAGRVILVGFNVDATIGTIGGAKSATDAMVLDYDLEVLAAMNGVNGTAGHAMGRVARAAGCGDHVIGEPLSVPKHAGHWNTVRFRSVTLNTTPGAFVTAGAAIEIEHQNAPGLV